MLLENAMEKSNNNDQQLLGRDEDIRHGQWLTVTSNPNVQVERGVGFEG